MNNSVKRISVTSSSVYAFEISGEVSAQAMESMAEIMNDAFDTHESKVDLMLIFRDFQGSEAGATWDGDVIRSRFRALSNVDKYVVVGAPERAEGMLDMFGKLLPVDARTFELSEIDAAWSVLGLQAPTTTV